LFEKTPRDIRKVHGTIQIDVNLLTKDTMKSQRKKYSLPNNINFWRFSFRREGELLQFLERGSLRQVGDIIEALSYFKTAEPEFFESIKGSVWLNKFKVRKKECKQ
jgi:hypothetical protein